MIDFLILIISMVRRFFPIRIVFRQSWTRRVAMKVLLLGGTSTGSMTKNMRRFQIVDNRSISIKYSTVSFLIFYIHSFSYCQMDLPKHS